MNMKYLFGSGGRRGRWLIVLGILLLVYALFGLYRMDPVAQFMAPSAMELTSDELSALPEGEPLPESELSIINSDWEDLRAELGEGVKAGMAAYAYEYSVSSAAQNVTATLVGVGEGWFDAHPRYLTDGCLFSHAEYASGAHKAVLDEELAFQLFPTTDACGSRVQLGGIWYDVIGVVRRAETPGDTDEYRIYIPLNAVANARIQTDYTFIECMTENSGAKRALQTVADEILGDGSYYDVDKEVMRATMIVRVMAIIFALYTLARLLGAWNRRTLGLIRGWNEEVMRRYFKTMLPKVIALSLAQLAGYAVLALAAWAVLSLTIEPMYVFTEWIPENFVSWTSLSGRFKDLLLENAQPVIYRTREYAAIRFYGALARWGVLSILAGFVLYRKWPVRSK